MTNNKIFFKQHLLRAALLISIGMILIACNTAQTSPNTAQAIEYRGAQFGFRLSYPAQWQVLEDPPPMVGDNPTILHAVTLQPPQDSKALVVVYIQTLTTTQTLAEYASQQMISLGANEVGATFSDLAVTQLGGLDARSTNAADDKSQLRRMIITLNNAKAYAVLLFGPPSNDLAAQFETMVQSFRFLP
jgi:predicted Zn-dependent protease